MRSYGVVYGRRTLDDTETVKILALGGSYGAYQYLGKLDAHENMATADLFAVSKQLPEQNAGVVTIPCPQGAGSPSVGQDQT